MPPGREDAGERILDVALYAPLGLVVTVIEAMPELVRKGRERLGPQVGMARTIGQFAVRQGYRQVAGLASSRPAFPFRPGPFRPGPFRPGRQTRTASEQDLPRLHRRAIAPRGRRRWHDSDDVGGDHDQTAVVPALPAGTDLAPPEEHLGAGAEHLAIPSYDSLSAPQVVQRLTGLSRDEIAAVAAYEAATRQRKAILVRAEQLLT